MTVSGTLPPGTRARVTGATDRTSLLFDPLFVSGPVSGPPRRHVTSNASLASAPVQCGHSVRNSSPSISVTPPSPSVLTATPSSPLNPFDARMESTARTEPAAATRTVDAVTSPSDACSTVPPGAGSSRTSAKVRYADTPRCVAVNGACTLTSVAVSNVAVSNPSPSASPPSRTPRSSAVNVAGGPSLRHSTYTSPRHSPPGAISPMESDSPGCIAD